MGNTQIKNSEPKVVVQDQKIVRKKFYTINFNNETSRIDFRPNSEGKNIEIVDLLLSLFDNIHADLNTNKLVYNIGAGDVTVTIPQGFYSTGVDLVAALNTQMSAAGFTWTFNIVTKRINVSHASNITFTDSRLVNLILGFESGEVNGSTNSFESSQLMNLYPYSHYILQCDKINSNSFFATNRTASISIPVDTFNFISSTSIKFDRNSYYNNTLELNSENVFPLDIKIYLLFLDDTLTLIPFTDNQKCSITFMI